MTKKEGRSTYRFGEFFLPALARGIWKGSVDVDVPVPVPVLGDWSRGVGDGDARGSGDTGPFTRDSAVEAGLGFWTTIGLGSCGTFVVAVLEIEDSSVCDDAVVLRPDSGLMELAVEGGTTRLADEELCICVVIDGDLIVVGGQAGILYRDGLLWMSDELGVRVLGWADGGVVCAGAVLLYGTV